VCTLEPWSVATVAGVIQNYQERHFRSGGGKAAFFDVEDMSGRVKAKLRGDRIDTYGHLLGGEESVLVTGKVSYPVTDDPEDEKEPTLMVDEVVPLADAVRSATRGITVRLSSKAVGTKQLEDLKSLLGEFPGACPVELHVELPEGARAVFGLEGIRVDPGDRFLAGLERVFGGTVADLR
jgi:DNA polymerase-3 subunit alpha